MNTLDLVPDADFLTSGIIKYIKWNYVRNPHAVIFGSTGSGKTYFLKLLLGRIGNSIKDAEIILCDFKGDEDFTFAEDQENFFRFDACMDGLQRTIGFLRERQADVKADRHTIFLVFDEWASFVTSLEKKQADIAKQSLAQLLMLGRSFHIHVIISQQRLDASYFTAGVRDNFSLICGMGHLSKESVEMMFSEYKSCIKRDNSCGRGILVSGNSLHAIVVPKIRNQSKLHSAICHALAHSQI